MRWNNLGIGLLDQLQHADAVNAFEQVVRLRPDYKDGYINLGLTYIDWEKYDEARQPLEKALGSKSRRCARALTTWLSSNAARGNTDAEIADLEKWSHSIPIAAMHAANLESPTTSEHRADDAIAQFKALQAIDPDDLAAHYNLAILYRRKGMKQRPKRGPLYTIKRMIRPPNVFAGLSAQASRNFDRKRSMARAQQWAHSTSELQAGNTVKRKQ